MRKASELRPRDLVRLRMRSLLLSGPSRRTPSEVIGWFGAMQAQDYRSALWAIGLRTSDVRLADVERAVAEGTIVRTWPMRGTLHFLPAPNVRWMLSLLTPRILRAMERRQHQLGLEPADFARSARLIQNELQGGRRLKRSSLFALLEADGIATASQRGYHITCRLAQEALICFGPPEGRDPTFVLLDEWVPARSPHDREGALTELARSYFRSHGPATVHDFAWWSGLTMGDARSGIEAVASEFTCITCAGRTYWLSPTLLEEPDMDSSSHLLPAFDEHLLGYTDRSAVLSSEHAPMVVPGNNGVFQPTVTRKGKTVGIWKRRMRQQGLALELRPFDALSKAGLNEAKKAAKRYGRFLGHPVTVA